MKLTPRSVLCMLALASVVPLTHAEGPLGYWSPRDLEGMTKRRWEAAANKTPAEILKLNRELKTWPEACEVVAGAKEYAGSREFLGQVAEQLTDPTLTRLEFTYRLIQWERIRAGDLVFPGRGFVVYDDVFTVAGRANWILRTVTEKSFGYVKPGAAPEELAALQRTWNSYLNGGAPAEVEPRYRSDAGGEDELFDPLAIELMIRSLSPSPAKEALIQTCLAKVGVKELPADPATEPAALCNPDVMAHMFLRQVTDVETALSAEAWAAWWTEHRDSLRWNQKTGKFESRSESASTN